MTYILCSRYSLQLMLSIQMLLRNAILFTLEEKSKS